MVIKTKLYRWWGALLSMPLISSIALAEDPQTLDRDFGMTPLEHYNHVLNEVLVDITVIGIVFTVITLYLIFKYRKKSEGQVGESPKLSSQAVIGWFIIPVALFLADDIYLFVKGWDLHEHMRKVPENAYEIKVTGAMWSWTYDYPNGESSINELVVPLGQPILLRLTSLDVLHGHYLHKYKVTEDAVPGRINYQWFLPDEVGESVVTCREYCGMMHSGMYGKLKVVTRPEFDTWLAEHATAKVDDPIGEPTKVAVSETNNNIQLN